MLPIDDPTWRNDRRRRRRSNNRLLHHDRGWLLNNDRRGLLNDNRRRLLNDDGLRLGSRPLGCDDVAHQRRPGHGGSRNRKALKESAAAPAVVMMVMVVDRHRTRTEMSARTRKRENAARARNRRDNRKNLFAEVIHDVSPFTFIRSGSIALTLRVGNQRDII